MAFSRSEYKGGHIDVTEALPPSTRTTRVSFCITVVLLRVDAWSKSFHFHTSKEGGAMPSMIAGTRLLLMRALRSAAGDRLADLQGPE
jgi:hypothetical protein